MRIIKKIISRNYIFLIVSFGLVLRLLILLANKNFQYDEAVVWKVSNLDLKTILFGNYFEFRFHPPLFYLFMHIWKTISDSESWLRLPTFIVGVINIWLIYLVGKRLKDHYFGLFAGLLIATSAYHIFWSLQWRVYELLLCVSLLYILLFLDTITGRTKKKWLLLTLVGLIGFGLDYSFIWTYFIINVYFVLTIFLDLSKNKYFILNKDNIKKWCVANLIIILLIFFYIWRIFSLAVNSKEALSTWIPVPTIDYFIYQLIDTVKSYFVADYFDAFLTASIPNNSFSILPQVLIIFSLLSSFMLLLKRYGKHSLILIMVYLPLFISFFISQFYPIFIAYNFMIVSIGVIFLFSYVISQFKLTGYILVTCWILINFLSYKEYLVSPSIEDWSTTLSSLQEHLTSDSSIIFSPSDFDIPFRYHNKNNFINNNEIIYNDYEIYSILKDLIDRNINHCLIARNSFLTDSQGVGPEKYLYKKEDISGIKLYCNY